MGDEIKLARRVIQAAFEDDEGFRDVYTANVACAIMDNPKKKDETAHEWRNRIADIIIDLIFKKE